MKWIRFTHNGRDTFGRVHGDTIAQTDLTWVEVLAGQQGQVVANWPTAAIQPLYPVPNPAKIVCIGLNYLDHCRETGIEPPSQPLIFTKFTSSLANPQDPIVWEETLTEQVDFEAELAVVIGRTARHVPVDQALTHVAGYTIANDVSARDLQFGDGQWVRGKSLDTFCPLGPYLVTADEIPDPQALKIRCEVNGNVMQDSHTGEMIFGVAELISFCSRSFTLFPGDLILTGTPHGVGLGRTPRVWLQDGDLVTIEIENLGRLQNSCHIQRV